MIKTEDKKYSVEGKEVTVLIHADNVESGVYNQIDAIKRHPAMKSLIAIMPDCHHGYGVPIGFTGRFGNAVIPMLVGVDIGCGVVTYKLPSDIELDLKELYTFIETSIPAGTKSHKNRPTIAGSDLKILNACEALKSELKLNCNPTSQVCTLGSGNHFIEIEQSETTGDKHITIHSGSRKFGLEVANYHQKKAKALMKSMSISVPKDLEYLPMNFGGDIYIKHMHLAREYASINRNSMLHSILKFLNVEYIADDMTESVHNYISTSDGIIRKGAISAHVGEKVVIPLNMGIDGGIIIGEGLGNKAYNFSAPHGAGRVKGRAELKRALKSGEISMSTFEDSTKDIYTKNIIPGCIDEAPLAYKPRSHIEPYLIKTIKVKDHLKPILVFKGM